MSINGDCPFSDDLQMAAHLQLIESGFALIDHVFIMLFDACLPMSYLSPFCCTFMSKIWIPPKTKIEGFPGKLFTA